ncbi:MnmC family methyltransferase [Helicobacter jaachi]|uniref:MnmC family methyltransferase n=1 Tax=Helicobacter jaachi TaxID=1677920 RepID=UPI00068BDA11|nr:MnmC family methyltransferase [Helicobacter jaachi]
MSRNWLRESSDGSLSAYNSAFDECYHSLKDGALSETLHKHIYPSLEHICALDSINTESATESSRADSMCGDSLRALDCGALDSINALNLSTPLYVLDICFGLGYNSLALLATLAQNGFSGRVEIYSPELDESIFTRLRTFSYPALIEDFKDKDKILHFLESAPYGELSAYESRAKNMEFRLHIYKADALKLLAHLPQGAFHIVYQDAFSPKKNPTLWSEAYFCSLARLLHTQGIITTYSQSKAIRTNALNAGLYVYDYGAKLVRAGSLMSKAPLALKQTRQILS